MNKPNSAKLNAKNPLANKPKLKIGPVMPGIMPRSLSALLVQLNAGYDAMAVRIQENASIGTTIPIRHRFFVKCFFGWTCFWFLGCLFGLSYFLGFVETNWFFSFFWLFLVTVLELFGFFFCIVLALLLN